MPNTAIRIAALPCGLLLVAALLPEPAHAQGTGTEAPELAFQRFEPPPSWTGGPYPELAVPSFVAPELDRRAAFVERAEREGLARPAVKAAPIRRGLGPAARPGTERAVGLTLQPSQLSLATALVSGDGSWSAGETRLDWTLARNAGAAADGLSWGAATGGGFGFAGSAEQRASASLGYRHHVFEHVTLISQIAVATRYEFAEANFAEVNLVPELRVVADLTQPMATPWKTVIDVKFGRSIPLAGSGPENSASAMLRLDWKAPRSRPRPRQKRFRARRMAGPADSV